MSAFIGLPAHAEEIERHDPQFRTYLEEVLDEETGRVVGHRTRWFIERACIEQYQDGRVVLERVRGEPITIGSFSVSGKATESP